MESGKSGVLNVTAEIYRNEGFAGFFSGVGSSLILIINPIINYVIYEYLKKFFKGFISFFMNSLEISFRLPKKSTDVLYQRCPFQSCCHHSHLPSSGRPDKYNGLKFHLFIIPCKKNYRKIGGKDESSRYFEQDLKNARTSGILYR